MAGGQGGPMTGPAGDVSCQRLPLPSAVWQLAPVPFDNDCSPGLLPAPCLPVLKPRLSVSNSSHPPQAAGPARIVRDRHATDTAPLRCVCYAACSELAASPHDLDPRPALRERIGIGAAIPYAAGLDALLAELAAAELPRLQAEYSGLFEVGSQGPPVPIREDLHSGQRAGIREDVVRFYDYFNYRLSEKFAWQPDHLSVELEFMHFLCYREARAGADALSYQLAQLDFAGRHLARWVPDFARSVAQLAPGSLYARAMGAVAGFVAGDHQWQQDTVLADGGMGAAQDSR